MPRWTTVNAAARVYRADYTFGSGGLATCTAIGLEGDGLALISPPAGKRAEPILAELDGLGRVEAVVAPNGNHRLGIPGAAERYPEAGVFAPEGVVERIQERSPRPVQPLAALQERLPEPVALFAAPHVVKPDLMARVTVDGGAIWVLHDLLVNLSEMPSNPALHALLWVLGFRVGLRMNRMACRVVYRADRRAFPTWLSEALAEHPPVAFVPGHGPVVDDDEGLARFREVAAAGW
ncbi:MAG: hypothetical protein H6739_30805 [Alphaproteobacteria bacterium]|nr:hypothetical protein [Alphaproteobacteria bacterium]